MGGDGVHVVRQVPPRKNTPMDGGVQGLYPPVQHLREPGEILDAPSVRKGECSGDLGRAGAVFKNGKLIERPDESEGADQQVA